MHQIGYKDSELGIVVTKLTSSPLLVEHPLLVKYSKLTCCTSVWWGADMAQLIVIYPRRGSEPG